MKKQLFMVLGLCLVALFSCDVHQWPYIPSEGQLCIKLKYSTPMNNFEGGETQHMLSSGQMRYLVRVYPQKSVWKDSYLAEYLFTKEISQGYDTSITVTLPKGDYDVMVWSDFRETIDSTYFYDPTNFADVNLQGIYRGNTDYRDAFKGVAPLSLHPRAGKNPPDTLVVDMARPLARYEFITNDMQEFMNRQPNPATDISEYTVVIFYPGFMPDNYNFYSDRPTDSTPGVLFASSLNMISRSEASLGFDYVFVDTEQTAIQVQIAILDGALNQVALSGIIEVPLLRNYNTVLTGSFLMQQATGGIHIQPDFDGNFNIIYY